MAERSTGLWVALAAGALLVGVVAVDASVTRTVALEVRDDEGDWQQLASTERDESPHRPGPEIVLDRNRTDELQLRITVDNEPPWSYEADYRVQANGATVASGTLTAEGGATGQTTVAALVADVLDGRGPPGEDRHFVSTEATVGTQTLHGGLAVEEVAG
jgi:hypothetical protein